MDHPLNSPETIMLMFALNKIGAVANMVDGSSTANELKKYIVEAGSSVVFTLDMFKDKFAEIADQANLKTVVVTNITRSMSFVNKLGARYIKGLNPKALPNDSCFKAWNKFFCNSEESKITFHDSNAPAVIVYTGGTTGGSKGAVLSNKAVNSVVFQNIIQAPEARRESTWIQSMPLFITYGVLCLMIPLTVGMTLIVRIPMSDSIAQLYQKFKPNHIVYGPAFWEAFADDNLALDLSNLIAPTTGGDILITTQETKINQYLNKCGSKYPILNGYGMTETSATVSLNIKYAHKLGSAGIPLVKNIIAAFDTESGQELKCGEKGEICICTQSMMKGYINNPTETQNIIRRHEDGKLWVHSGDIGYITEDGFVFIIGRLKRYFLYKANGICKKIFSLDIERCIMNHQRISNCAVVPVSDATIFQKAVAFVIIKNEYRSDNSTENEIKAYCEQNLQDGYRPVKYIFMEKFPLTKVGKIDYRELEKMAESQSKGE